MFEKSEALRPAAISLGEPAGFERCPAKPTASVAIDLSRWARVAGWKGTLAVVSAQSGQSVRPNAAQERTIAILATPHIRDVLAKIVELCWITYY